MRTVITHQLDDTRSFVERCIVVSIESFVSGMNEFYLRGRQTTAPTICCAMLTGPCYHTRSGRQLEFDLTISIGWIGNGN
jgi:hypothetical protein